MKKIFKSYIAIWSILLVLFNVISFVSVGWINQEKYTPSFWIGYIFISLSFIGQLVSAKIAFNAKNLQKLFYNIPLITLSWSGLIASFVAGGLCMLISPLPYWVGVIVCVLILAITGIAVVKAQLASDTVESVDQKIKNQTFFIKSLTIDAESLIAKAKNDSAKNECKKVYEAIRYSDPKSNEAISSVESEITIKFAKLSEAVGNNSEKISEIASELIVLLEDRNKKCKLLK